MMMGSELLSIVGRLLRQATRARQVIGFWGPVLDTSTLVAPLLAIASVVSLAFLAGVAVTALTVLLVALIGLYTLLTQVFGVSIMVA